MITRNDILKIFIAILLISNLPISNYSQSRQFPKLVVIPDKDVRQLLIDPGNFTIWDKYIKKGLERAYRRMWSDFIESGKNDLPVCVYNAFNLLRRLEKIEITFSMGNRSEFSTGDITVTDIHGEFLSKMDKFGRQGVIIYGIWQSNYSESYGDRQYCLKGLIFHEILHYCFYGADKKFFDVRDINNPRVTDNNNFWSDEGIIEDCELLLFPCGPDFYLRNGTSWYINNSRRYNTEADDCALCKLCK